MCMYAWVSSYNHIEILLKAAAAAVTDTVVAAMDAAAPFLHSGYSLINFWSILFPFYFYLETRWISQSWPNCSDQIWEKFLDILIYFILSLGAFAIDHIFGYCLFPLQYFVQH